MRYRILLGLTAASAVCVAYALNVLQLDIDDRRAEASTLTMAPISLGNPLTAATLKTQRPLPPRNFELEFKPAIYQQNVEVGKGDTLAKLLNRAGVTNTEAHHAITALSEHYNPRRIKRGQDLTISFRTRSKPADARLITHRDTFMGLALTPDYKTEIKVTRTDAGTFTAEQVEKTLDRHPVRADGVINNSLYVAGRDAGVPAVVIARLIRILSWDVDFQRDIREGDRFEILYERVADENGKTVYNGNVLYAALTLSGKKTTVYRHKMKDGVVDYFDDKGRAARKALMRTPIDGARLSSRYGKRRHPVLGYKKMHRGIDFAAPRGTPIYAAGNGTVEVAGRKGSYGNYIRIRHNGTYKTAYAHLKSFARGVRSGKRVQQGQVVGYVGTTGRSTGPHLHYEILMNGRQVNPLSIRMPSGKKLQGKALERFMATRAQFDETFASLPTEQSVAEIR